MEHVRGGGGDVADNIRYIQSDGQKFGEERGEGKESRRENRSYPPTCNIISESATIMGRSSSETSTVAARRGAAEGHRRNIYVCN